MKSRATGFTLIELIAVIVILGVLAVSAVPKFIDLSDAAKEAAVEGIAGALTSASVLNHANNLAADAGLTVDAPTTVDDCADAATLLDGGLDAKYAITAGTGTPIGSVGGVDTEGGASTCTVASATDATINATFTAYGVQ